MNKLSQNLFLLLYPFYPLLAWGLQFYFNKPIEFFVTILFAPLALYFIIYVNKKLPTYLIFFIVFVIFHLCSALVNNTLPKDVNKIYFLLSDHHLLACFLFIVIEYTVFDEDFIGKMNKRILLVVILSLIVSLIQIKIPTFFFNTTNDEELLYLGENRNFSIYSWVNLNSLGISFPCLISILVSTYEGRKSTLAIVFFCGLIVSFLTRARYVMISAIVVLSQPLFNKRRSIGNRASLAITFLVGILFIGLSAHQLGYDINEVINTRILEKDSDMGSAKARILSYEVFLVVFPKNPWLGVGPETKKDVVDLLGGEAPLIHVGYLSYLYFYGLVGSLFLFIAIFFLLKGAWTIGKKNNFWGSFYGLIAFCLANTTFVYFNFSEMGIVLSVIYMRFYTHKSFLPIDHSI